jgi:hypothetical protein
MLRIWLKDNVTDEQLADLKRSCVGVETSKKGKRFVSHDYHILDPTIDIPDVPPGMIERFTVKDNIYQGLRQEGLYYLPSGAKMLLFTLVYYSDFGANRYQEISASAPSIDALREIYTLVRQEKICPIEDWDDHEKTQSSKPTDNPTNLTHDRTETELDGDLGDLS